MKARSIASFVLAAWLTVGAAGAALADDSTTQGSNSSTGATSTTGGTTGTNTNSISGGPSASGSTNSSAQQTGDNRAAASQRSKAKTGDAVAGSQITGGVGGSHTVQNQNNADGATATSGAAELVNELDATAGPSALDALETSAQQNGDNVLALEQSAETFVGDAVGGAQITGLVAGDGDEVTVQNQNYSTDITTISGEADGLTTTLNVLVGVAGPFSNGVDSAQVAQLGDNVLDITQFQTNNGGDSVAGAQITGVVAGDNSEIEIQNQNVGDAAPAAFAGSTGDAVAGSQITGAVSGAHSETEIQESNAATGDGITTADSSITAGANVAIGVAGPIAATDGDAQASQVGDNAISLAQSGDDLALAALNAGPLAAGLSIVTGTQGTFIELTEALTASVSQIGDNGVVASQDTSSVSGDAVAGSQITGSVTGHGSETTAQLTNTSVDASAETADMAPVNGLAVGVGPTALGTDLAQAQQVGDDAADISQTATGETGDAVAGSQISGLVGGEDATLQTQQNSTFGGEGDGAVSGNVDGVNGLVGSLGPVASSSAADANAQQSGDTDSAVGQDLSSNSGDAVSGGQISGRVGDV